MEVSRLIEILSSYTFSLNDEKVCQREIAEVLTQRHVEFEREFDLRPYGGAGIVDFLVGGCVAVEVKLKGQRKSVYRQCRDYCKSDNVESLVLLSSLAMKLPEEIEGKSCFVVSLGSAYL